MKQTRHTGKSTTPRISATCVAVLGGAMLLLGTSVAEPGSAPPEEGTYIGASKCKSCHSAEDTGDQFGTWESGLHAKTFDVLASEEALAIAKEKGIADPQKADACLKCHVTAHGVDEARIKKGFKAEMGVQCESCHGPGEAHQKARFKAAMSDAEVPVTPDELVAVPEQEVCLGCHNEESPTFKPFCYYRGRAQIRHLQPETDAGAMPVCGCPDPCPCEHGCPDDGCAVPQSEKEM